MRDSWYHEKFKDRRHTEVFSTMEALRNQQQDRLRMLEIYRLLYSDDSPQGYNQGVSSSVGKMRESMNRFSENLIRSVVDTVCAKIGKNSPKPFVVSSGGDGSLRRKGKGLNMFLLGKFDQLKANNRLRTILRDAAITGTGAGKLCIDYQTKDFAFERVPLHQLFVDENETRYASPSQLFQVTPCSKELLMQLYPQQAQSIKSSAPPIYSTYAVRRKEAILVEEVEVIEAWKLPDQPGKPGRHTICTSMATLIDEPWEDELPFVWIHFSEPLSGFWGQGLAQLLMDVQYRVNYTLLMIQENIRLCSRPTWLVSQTANVAPAHIRNVAGNILQYKGSTPPQLAAFTTTSQEVFQWLQDQRNRAFEIAGISQMSAEGKRPTADISGIALETMNDVESERFIMFGKAYEQASVDLAEKLIAMTRREYEKDDPDTQESMFKAFYSRSWQISQVKWSEVNMKRDQFNLNVFPISSLPQSISGRQQKIQDLLSQGMLDTDTARELLDFPDYERWSDLQQAGKDNAERLVESVLYDGADPVVEKYHNIAYMLTYTQNLYNQQQLVDGDEEKLERLRQLIDQCQDLMDQSIAAKQAQTASPAPTPANAQGVPE